MSNKMIGFRASDEERRRYEELAEREHRTLSSWIRWSLDREAQRQELLHRLEREIAS